MYNIFKALRAVKIRYYKPKFYVVKVENLFPNQSILKSRFHDNKVKTFSFVKTLKFYDKNNIEWLYYDPININKRKIYHWICIEELVISKILSAFSNIPVKDKFDVVESNA